MTRHTLDEDLGRSPTPDRHPDNGLAPAPGNENPPTRRQLAYLRGLANRTGQTFAYPRTASHANREIRRLKNAQPSSHVERAVERKQIADAIAAGPEDASRVREAEIEGFGSSATWSERS